MAPSAETPILSFYRNTPVEVSKEPDLLDKWWISEELYSLERRAIFSKSWICIAHRSRFSKPGDYISLELAGFPILIILGKDHIARAFHNVCRHRAYTITKKPAGSSLVLGCRYHGWSYDTKGSLVKAPQFDGIEGFNKSENGLFAIKTCTDRAGLIHVDLDAGNYTHVPELDDILGYADNYGIEPKSKWLLGWEMSGGFNWKTVGASDRTGIGTEAETAKRASIVDLVLALFRGSPLDLGDAKTLYLAPATTLIAFPKASIWASLTFLPVSASRCAVKCDVFSHFTEQLSDADGKALKSFFDNYVSKLEGAYMQIKDCRPSEEPALLSHLKSHLKLERLAGREIFPGRREEGRSESFCRAEKICKELDQLAHVGHDFRSAPIAAGHGSIDW